MIKYLKRGKDVQIRLDEDVKVRQTVNCCQFRSTTKESFSIVNHCSNIG